MNILITNDDGYQAIGIQTLYSELKSKHNVLMVAPDGERSAIGHGISLNTPMRAYPVKLEDGSEGIAMNGTPADCVKFALFKHYETKPDLVLSGINPGSNTGINLYYSGTAAAAREAALNNIPAMAVSIQQGKQMEFKTVAQLVCNLIEKMDFAIFNHQTFLNLNAPAGKIDKTRAIKITRQAPDNLSEAFVSSKDPKGNPYYWYARSMPGSEFADTDVATIEQGDFSLTPIQCDTTNHSMFAELGQALGLNS